MTRSRKATIGVIFVLAFITGFAAITATWVKRQVLDTGNWTDTSAKLLADKKIQTALGTYLVDELFNQSEVANALSNVLPKQAQALAGPASAGLQQLSLQLAPKLLARPRVQDAWIKANKAAHAQLINVIEGGGTTVSTKNGEVVLNLHELVNQLAAQLGVQNQVNAARAKLNSSGGAAAKNTVQQKTGLKLPADTGTLTIMRSDQLAAAQDYANGVKSMSIVLTIVSFGLFALAVYLARGARRLVFRGVGWSFLALGVLTLLVRRVGGNEVVNNLVQIESNKPAVHNAWNIATSMLYTIGIAFVFYGALMMVAAWLAGPQRWAVSLRQRMAPTLAQRPGLVYGWAGFAYLLLLLWGPTPAFRNFISIVLIACLIGIGIETLRRQTAREFPGPETPEPPERQTPPPAQAALAGR